MREDITKYFFLGIITGTILMVAPWWVSLGTILVIIFKELWSNNNDRPTQAQAVEKGLQEKEAKLYNTSSDRHSSLP